jgi:hypothetical protein
MRESRLESGGRYPVLRTIAILWMVGAIVVAVYGLFQSVVTLAGVRQLEAISSSPTWLSQITGCLVWLAGTFFAVIFSVAVAEGIKLFMDVEYNCRMVSSNLFRGNAMATSQTNTVAGGRIAGRLSETAESELIRGA